MRIAVFAREQEMSSYYRAYEPVEALALRGHERVVNTRDATPTPAMLDCDVALVSRLCGPSPEQLVQMLHRAGAAVVWQVDDATELAPSANPRSMRTRRENAAIRRMLQLCDMIVTTSELLAAHFGRLTKTPIRVIENYVGPQFQQVVRDRHPGLVIGWAAWTDHQLDWRTLGLQDVVTRLLEAHPDLRVQGVGPIDLGLPADRYRQTPAVRFHVLARSMASFDIGIAPIVDHPFNAMRSNIKVKEYAALGIPWLASPIGPYADLGEKQGGRLVADDRWYEELDRLIRDQRGRRKLAKRGRAWGATQTILRNADRWEDLFHDAIARAGRRRSGAA